MAPAPAQDEGKVLTDALGTVKIQVVQMKRHLDAEQLMDALKSASTMLSELRTSSLSPKQYYELYMAVFDALRYLSNYLYDAHQSGKHHLADLYELVQYAGNIVPRLYLMITVGAVYMSIPDAPVKEIMKDMMEMSRGVQHPTRGLFLRHYLSGQTRDYLPIGNDQGPSGNLADSIGFVLTNFIEMNKLWVRLQHQGHSRDREKRELERKELRILVGTNLVRLSQLEGVDLGMYQQTILPSILEQVVNCKDVIAQEYLMEVVIQVFTDEFHLHSLGPFLSATALLHPKVNIKQIVIALIDRLASYAAREAESEDPEEIKKQEEAAAKRLAERVRSQKLRAKENGLRSPDQAGHGDEWLGSTVPEATPQQEKPTPSDYTPKRFRGIPEDVKLFEVFWFQVVELIKARPDLLMQDITALLVSLTNLSLSCYPDRLEYVDQILAFATERINDFKDSPDLHNPQTTSNLLSLLAAPINSYQSVLTLLALPRYVPLLYQQPFNSRRSLAHSIVSSVLKNDTVIDTPEDVDGVLELCSVLIQEQVDPIHAMNGLYGGQRPRAGVESLDLEQLAEEQGWVARMVHLFRADNLEVQFELLQTAKRHFERGGERMRFTYPSLITAAIRLARRYKQREKEEEDWKTKAMALLRFVRQLISVLSTTVEAHSISLRLFLLAAQMSDECGFEDLTYEFYVQAFTVYEDSINDSRAQLQAITLIINTLQGAKGFSLDNYDVLITKAALHGAKLLKKPHQSTAVNLASHMWWQIPSNSDAESQSTTSPTETKQSEDAAAESTQPKSYPHQDGKRVLECLQKSLRIASSAIEEIVTVQLYCDALDQYLYYMDHGVTEVTPKFVNSLVELISSNIDSISNIDIHPTLRAPPGLIEGVQAPEMIQRHFRNTLAHIRTRKASAAQESPWQQVSIVGALLKFNLSS
ncbi:Vacuolar protein sorting-associated protein 35 [Serendipita sp. 396]|nr:Vacuolar protein sorting-associated protein 35 [Serendipita sp. 396]KAG8786271.1 Vacuolar protein sorting-associated protein 35 [Serendipita sp. 397]